MDDMTRTPGCRHHMQMREKAAILHEQDEIRRMKNKQYRSKTGTLRYAARQTLNCRAQEATTHRLQPSSPICLEPSMSDSV